MAEEADMRRVAGEACEALRALYGPGTAVRAEPVAGLAPDPPGKYRLARVLVPLDADALLDEQYALRTLEDNA